MACFYVNALYSNDSNSNSRAYVDVVLLDQDVHVQCVNLMTHDSY